MGDQIYVLIPGEKVPVEPVGAALSQGWLPGTWVKWSTQPVSFSNAIGTVERSDGTGLFIGFLLTGPQHLQPVELLSDMWTTDQRQRSGGDGKADWGAIDASNRFEIDEHQQLQRMGSRTVGLFIAPTGVHKFYVFETEDSLGAPLVYQPGDQIYVSSNGLATKEQETPGHVWTGYVVAKAATDIEGDYLFFTAGVA